MKVSTIFVLALLLASPVAHAAESPSQEEAEQRVLWRTQGRERPSRRALKSQVREEMKNSSNSFIDYRLELRQAQQQRTIEGLRTTRQIRNDEAKEEREAEQIEDRKLSIDRNANRRLTRQIDVKIKTVRSIPVDTRKCASLHVRARRMCIIDLRRNERTRLHSQEVQSIREELGVAKDTVNVPFPLRVLRQLQAKPLSRRSTSGSYSGATELQFPDAPVEPEEEPMDEAEEESEAPSGVQSQTSN